MSGLATAATIAAISSAAVGAGTLGYSIYSGNRSADEQKQALKNQNTAQQTATDASLSTERAAAVAQGAANQQTPNIAGILQRAATAGTGMSSTMLTGPGGVDTTGLNLGKSSLLGS